MPLVSVIVPNYNHARFLPLRLGSILGQTCRDFEVIVLDDASTDGSREEIARHLGDPRVRFHPNGTNSGSPSVQWNRGVALARAPLVWIAESDDYAAPEFLAAMTDLLARTPGACLACCQSWTVDADGTVTGDASAWMDDVDPGRWLADYTAPGRDECARHLLWKNTIPNASAVLFRREAYLRAGGAPVGMRLSGDWLTWVRMLLLGDFAFTARKLNFFRQHPGAVRATTDQRRISMERWAVRSLISRRCRLDGAARARLAASTAGELVWLVGNAPRGAKTGVLLKGLRASWPLLVRSPLAVLGTIAARARK